MEVLLGERTPTSLFPQANAVDRSRAREQYVLNKTVENSSARDSLALVAYLLSLQ